jgi:hypothetical protein
MKLNNGKEIEDFFCQLTEIGQLLTKPDHEIMKTGAVLNKRQCLGKVV